jgi:hypothetical protein
MNPATPLPIAADALSALKLLLRLVTDPAAHAERLDQLQESQTRHDAIFASATVKEAENAKRAAELDKREADIKARDIASKRECAERLAKADQRETETRKAADDIAMERQKLTKDRQDVDAKLAAVEHAGRVLSGAVKSGRAA